MNPQTTASGRQNPLFLDPTSSESTAAVRKKFQINFFACPSCREGEDSSSSQRNRRRQRR